MSVAGSISKARAQLRGLITGQRAVVLVLGTLLASLSLIYFTQDLVGSRVAATRAHGDGVYYYAYLRSMVFDRDLDLDNDYELLGNPFPPARAKTGKVGNPHAAGSALFWLPTLGAAHAVLGTGNLLGLSHQPLNGVPESYQRIVFYGSLLWGFAALLLIFRVSRRQTDRSSALLAVLGMALATPLGWYMVRQASFSHANSAFAVAAMAAYWLSTLRARSVRQWGLLGLLAGLAMLVRTQNVGHLVLPLGELLVALVTAAYRRDPRRVGRLLGSGLVFVCCGAAAFSPQLFIWRVLYGTWFTIPQGESFMLWEHSRWLAVLFSSRNGLLAFHPILSLGVVGLLVMALRRPWRGDSLAAVLMLLALAVQVYINGSARDWWGGWAFGGRRFLSCSLYLGLGLAWLLFTIKPLLARAARWAAVATTASLVLLLVLFNFSMMERYLWSEGDAGTPRPMVERWKAALGGGFDALYGAAGNPGSAPASWAFAAQHGVSPARYDLLLGTQLFDKSPVFQQQIARGKLTLDGFDEVVNYREVLGIWAPGEQATLALPLRVPVEIHGRVLLHPASPGTRVWMSVGGEIVFEAELVHDWKIYDFQIPASALDAGLNYIRIRQRLPQPRRWPIGQTGRSSMTEVTVVSRGNLAGGFQSLFVFGRQQISEGRRGVAAYRFDPVDGVHVRMGAYDTFLAKQETARLVADIRGLPPGACVALAIRDDASRRWTAAADRALRSLGGSVSLMGAYRKSYALIGVKGARPGQALETLTAHGPARVRLGRPREDRFSGVSWAEIRLERKRGN